MTDPAQHPLCTAPMSDEDVRGVLLNVRTWTCHARACGRPLGEYQILFTMILNELLRRGARIRELEAALASADGNGDR